MENINDTLKSAHDKLNRQAIKAKDRSTKQDTIIVQLNIKNDVLRHENNILRDKLEQQQVLMKSIISNMNIQFANEKEQVVAALNKRISELAKKDKQ